MMNASLKAAAVAESSRANLFQLRAALFHSTPVLERGRRQQGQPVESPPTFYAKFLSLYLFSFLCKFDCCLCIPLYCFVQRFTYSRRPRKHKWKSHVLRNFNSYAEDLFESWIPFLEQDDPRNTGPSWFRRQQGASGSRSQGNPNHGHKARGRRGFQFCDEDNFNAETIFRSAFGGERISFWSFVNEDSARWRSSSAYTNGHRGRSWHWRIDNDNDDKEDESSSDTDSSESTSASDRLALGLSPYGPLKLDDVKHAYRTCALKFHPDRHQGPSKNAAEEKFKSCTAAYQSLCDKLTVN